jgi:hypothetical protein
MHSTGALSMDATEVRTVRDPQNGRLKRRSFLKVGRSEFPMIDVNVLFGVLITVCAGPFGLRCDTQLPLSTRARGCSRVVQAAVSGQGGGKASSGVRRLPNELSMRLSSHDGGRLDTGALRLRTVSLAQRVWCRKVR